ncbi:MAG: UrcA family protein [Parasphingorhabdus sp.]|uniref:UrcA family protein n=1 Tax=Parasphingorhabdus sp. TaxID=2709688 RepID=UPI00329828D0
MKNSILSKGLCAAAAIAVTATGFAASASSASAQNRMTRSVEISYADLDLTSADGQDTLDGRIKGAVRQVCGSYDSKSLRDMADHKGCVKEAKFSAKRAKVSLIARAEAGTLGTSTVVIGGN